MTANVLPLPLPNVRNYKFKPCIYNFTILNIFDCVNGNVGL